MKYQEEKDNIDVYGKATFKECYPEKYHKYKYLHWNIIGGKKQYVKK